MISALNGVRGIAVLLVFTSHTPIRLFIGDFGQQAVYIFFVLSSFLLTLSLLNGVDDITHYMKKRFLRIYPLYALIVTSIAIVTHINFNEYIINILFLQKIYDVNFILSVSWSLLIEIQMYLLLPIFLYLLMRKDKFNYKLFTLIIIFTYVLRIYNFNHYLLNASNGSMKIIDGNIWEVVDIFLIGIILAVQYKKDKLFPIGKACTLFALFIFITIPFLLNLSEINRAYQVIYILIPIYSVLIYVLFTSALLAKEKLLNYILNLNILNFYAKISYSFYLIHLPILIFFRENFQNSSDIFIGLIAFGTITFMSWFLYNYFEKFFLKFYK